MFNLASSFAPLALLACLAPNALDLDAAPAPAVVAEADFAPLPSVSARLVIQPIGGGYYQVIVSGQSSAANATLGVRVYGEDTWFDDLLFSMGAYSRTAPDGYFSVSQTVYRSTLNEDWEGADEIYAVVSVTNAGSVRTNKITQSF